MPLAMRRSHMIGSGQEARLEAMDAPAYDEHPAVILVEHRAEALQENIGSNECRVLSFFLLWHRIKCMDRRARVETDIE